MRSIYYVIFSIVQFLSLPAARAEDTLCSELYAAQQRTQNSGRYQLFAFDIVPKVRENPLILYELRIVDRVVYENSRMRPWIKFKRPILDTKWYGVLIYQNCHLEQDDELDGMPANVFSVTWQKGDRKADARVWVSSETGRLLQVHRTLTSWQNDKRWFLKEGTVVVEKFTYDRTILEPPPFQTSAKQ